MGIALGGQGRDQGIDLELEEPDGTGAKTDGAQAWNNSVGDVFLPFGTMIDVVFKVSLADSDALARHFGP